MEQARRIAFLCLLSLALFLSLVLFCVLTTLVSLVFLLMCGTVKTVLSITAQKTAATSKSKTPGSTSSAQQPPNGWRRTFPQIFSLKDSVHVPSSSTPTKNVSLLHTPLDLSARLTTPKKPFN